MDSWEKVIFCDESKIWIGYDDDAPKDNNNWLIGLVGREFAHGPGGLGSTPGCVIPKNLKRYLILPCLTLSDIRYVSRLKWSNPGKGVTPVRITHVVAIKNGALWLPSTTVPNFTHYLKRYLPKENKPIS